MSWRLLARLCTFQWSIVFVAAAMKGPEFNPFIAGLGGVMCSAFVLLSDKERQ